MQARAMSFGTFSDRHEPQERRDAPANMLDRAIAFVAPTMGLKRMVSRAKAAWIARSMGYDAASKTWRTEGWHVPSSSGNAAVTWTLKVMRDRVRDLCRNDAWMKAGLEVVETEVVGTGIVATISGPNKRRVDRIKELWKAWAESSACDADGQSDFYDLQAAVVRTMAESGSVLVRRRPRFMADKLPVPLQLELLEPDHLDMSRDLMHNDGTRVIGGIAFDQIKRRTGYWLFPYHPGDMYVWQPWASQFIPASEVLHVFKRARPGQVTDVPWPFSGVIRARVFSEYEDSTLQKQNVSAAFAGFIHDIEMPDALPTGHKDRLLEFIEPGTIETLPPGKTIEFPNPPTVSDYDDFSTVQLRAQAKAWGISYEALTGDWRRVNFASGRLGVIFMRNNIDKVRWRTVIPRFCDPVAKWFLQACELMGENIEGITFSWTTPRRAMLDPANDIAAARDAIRSGLKTMSETIRENGDNPEEHFEELEADMKRLDDMGLTIESDARVPLAGGAKAEQGPGNSETTDAVDPQQSGSNGKSKPKPKQLAKKS
jgi:lambda family phage portal protein